MHVRNWWLRAADDGAGGGSPPPGSDDAGAGDGGAGNGGGDGKAGDGGDGGEPKSGEERKAAALAEAGADPDLLRDFAKRAEAGEFDDEPGDDGDGGDGKGDDLAKPGALPKGLQDAIDAVPKNLQGKDAAETIAKLTKSFKDLRDRSGEVPDSVDGYKFEIQDDSGKLVNMESELDQDMLGIVKEVALENGLPAAAFSKFAGDLVGKFAEVLKDYEPGQLTEEQVAAAKQAEYEKLGGERVAHTLMRGMNERMTAMVKAEILSAEEAEAFQDACGSAAGLQMMAKVMTWSGEKPLPRAGVDLPGKVTKADLQKKRADPKYETDPAYRAQVDREYEEYYGK